MVSSAVSAGIAILANDSPTQQEPTLLQGPKGETGAAGEPGPRGQTGLTGATGATGPQGLQGETGATGPSGANGANGTNGATWLNGIGVPNPILGVNGDFYLENTTNDIFNKVSGAWTKISNIRGTTGTMGAIGPSGAVGAMGPQGPPGSTVTNYTNIGTTGNLNYNGNSIGDISLTAPTNGIIHVTVTGYVQMYFNNSCLLAIGSTPKGTDLDVTYV